MILIKQVPCYWDGDLYRLVHEHFFGHLSTHGTSIGPNWYICEILILMWWILGLYYTNAMVLNEFFNTNSLALNYMFNSNTQC